MRGVVFVGSAGNLQGNPPPMAVQVQVGRPGDRAFAAVPGGQPGARQTAARAGGVAPPAVPATASTNTGSSIHACMAATMP